MVLLSTEFWIVFQAALLMILFFFFIYYLKNFGQAENEKSETEVADKAAEEIMNLIEPVLGEAENSAKIFERQILEKKKIIRELNSKLDNRIITLTLLLNRADAALLKKNLPKENYDPSDTQDEILALYGEGYDSEYISKKLSLSREEVELVVGLKKKFLALENRADSETIV